MFRKFSQFQFTDNFFFFFLFPLPLSHYKIFHLHPRSPNYFIQTIFHFFCHSSQIHFQLLSSSIYDASLFLLQLCTIFLFQIPLIYFINPSHFYPSWTLVSSQILSSSITSLFFISSFFPVFPILIGVTHKSFSFPSEIIFLLPNFIPTYIFPSLPQILPN